MWWSHVSPPGLCFAQPGVRRSGGCAICCLSRGRSFGRGGAGRAGVAGVRSPCAGGKGQAQELRVPPVRAPKPRRRTCCPCKDADVGRGFSSAAPGDLPSSGLPSSQCQGDRCPRAAASDEHLFLLHAISCKKTLFFFLSFFSLATVRLVKRRQRLPREAVGSPSMEVLKTQWAAALGSPLQVTPARTGTLSTHGGPHRPQHFCDFPSFSPEGPGERGGPGGVARCPVVPGEERCGGSSARLVTRQFGRAGDRALSPRRV